MAAIVSTADMTGTWAGSFKYNEQDVPIRLALKGDSEITGTVEGLPGGTAQIKDGKLQGDNVTFWITIDYQGNPLKLVYKGNVRETKSSASSARRMGVGGDAVHSQESVRQSALCAGNGRCG